MKILYIIGILVVLGIFILLNTQTEGFTNSKDRTNPLASQQHPLNKTAEIGISVSEANNLRNMSKTALNTPLQIASGLGSYLTENSKNELSPRIDDETSFLAMVKFCKETGATAFANNSNPFDDTNFSKNCGMCVPYNNETITLISNETFTVPTGVVVYKEDKARANKFRSAKGYKYPRALPSLKAAVCPGATLSDNTIPVLAINKGMYNVMKNDYDCKKNNIISSNCGKCVTGDEDTDTLTYINPGYRYDTILNLSGNGTYEVKLNNLTKGTGTLTANETTINLGKTTEGDVFTIDVNGILQNSIQDVPYVYGNLESKTIDGTLKRIELTDTQLDIVTDDLQVQGSILSPRSGTSMTLTCSIPFTFIKNKTGHNNIAAYDCPTSYFRTSSLHGASLSHVEAPQIATVKEIVTRGQNQEQPPMSTQLNNLYSNIFSDQFQETVQQLLKQEPVQQLLQQGPVQQIVQQLVQQKNPV